MGHWNKVPSKGRWCLILSQRPYFHEYTPWKLNTYHIYRSTNNDGLERGTPLKFSFWYVCYVCCILVKYGLQGKWRYFGGGCQYPCSQWVNHLFILAFMKPNNRKAGSFACFIRSIFTQRLVEINIFCCNIWLKCAVPCHVFFKKRIKLPSGKQTWLAGKWAFRRCTTLFKK